MTRALAGLVLLAVATAWSVAACFVADPASTPAIASPVDGVVISVDAASLTDVRGFTLRTSDGASTAFDIGALENGAEFPPGHLVEHQSTAQPIRVWYRTEDGRKVAIRLEDAT